MNLKFAILLLASVMLMSNAYVSILHDVGKLDGNWFDFEIFEFECAWYVLSCFRTTIISFGSLRCFKQMQQIIENSSVVLNIRQLLW